MALSIVNIALPVPMRRLFDYIADPIPPGCRVEVVFGRRTLVGVVMSNADSSTVAPDKLKPIEKQLDQTPVLSASLLSLGNWLADYHHHPIGDVISTMLPSAYRKAVEQSENTRALCKLTALGEAQLTVAMRAKKQQALLSTLSSGAVSLDVLKRDFSAAIISACTQNAWVEQFSEVVAPDLEWAQAVQLSSKPRPTQEQALAISAMLAHHSSFQPFLLEGVTGSGKTEVYLQVIEPLLVAGKQVLILVPEIGLTPQTVQRFEKRFGLKVGVVHSGLTDNERLLVWQQAREGSLGLVIGTRSAVFTPFKQLSMIIVDEEHDESFKQQDGMRYHARDVAVLRAKRENAGLILGSATPSFESLNNALAKKYQLLQLHQRTGQAQLASPKLVDLRSVQLESGFAPATLNAMNQHLKAGGQVMVFLNRRGYAPGLVCHHCGFVKQCNRCDAPYTVHKSKARLHCHRCDDIAPIASQCEQCGHSDWYSQGVGTEQLEHYLAQAFVDYSCVRIDSDSMRGKRKLASVLDAINQYKHQILIGTQILAKGHHFPRVSMVVVLDVDAALFSPDMRATEKLAQLLTQVSGRAGRENRNGEMWLQTHHPEHALLQDLLHNGYGHFARFGLAERRAAGVPPFAHQTVFRAEANDAQVAEAFLNDIRHTLERQKALQVIGPLPATIYKRAGRYRMILIVQAAQRQLVYASIASQLDYIESLPSASRVRWAIDVAPTDLS